MTLERLVMVLRSRQLRQQRSLLKVGYIEHRNYYYDDEMLTIEKMVT